MPDVGIDAACEMVPCRTGSVAYLVGEVPAQKSLGVEI